MTISRLCAVAGRKSLGVCLGGCILFLTLSFALPASWLLWDQQLSCLPSFLTTESKSKEPASVYWSCWNHHPREIFPPLRCFPWVLCHGNNFLTILYGLTSAKAPPSSVSVFMAAMTHLMETTSERKCLFALCFKKWYRGLERRLSG